jgi:transcriptional regulator with XRE-family HTH domain
MKKANAMRDLNLRDARKQKGFTQQQAAKRLGVTQAYLSMLERKRRQIPAQKLSLVVDVYGLPPSALPFRGEGEWSRLHESVVASELAALGYPGFAYLSSGRPTWNPAELLLAVLTRDELETRVAEGLPWLAYAHSDLDWDWTVREARTHNVVNRLGFVVTLARELAGKKSDVAAAAMLREVEARLEPSVLLRTETFCREHMTQAERRWLREHSTPQARHWNVLSDVSSEDLVHAF